jgi:hypothetical protein
MTKTVISSFGTFDEKQLDALKKGIKELSDVFEMQAAQRDTAKEILDHLHEELKIPKKIIRKIAKTYHNRDYNKVVFEQEEFSLLFEGVVETETVQ